MSIVFLSEVKVRKTKKDQRCFGCCEVIPAGSEAHVHNLSDSGQAYSLYLHPACAEILDSIEPNYFYDNEIPEDAVREYLSDIGFEGTPEEYLAREK